MHARSILSFLLSLALVSVAPLWGCSSGEEPMVDPAHPAAHSFGLMAVGYTHDWQADADAPEGLELTTTAQFVRYSALDRSQVARLLALPLNPDADLPGVDTCRVYDLTIDLGGAGGLDGRDTATVDLLEAGDLEVETSSGTVKLAPRHFPGLLPFISGVVYGEAQSDHATKTGHVHVGASGGETVGSFRVEGKSPVLPKIATLGGEVPAREPIIGGAHDLALRWARPSADLQQDDDVFYVEVRHPAAKRDLVLRCTPKDDGRFAITAADLGKLMNGVRGRVVIDLVRVRRTFFAARGLDNGELRVMVRDRASVTLR